MSASNKPVFAPGTAEHDVFTLETRAGRARLFERRLNEILAQLKAGGKKATLDDALHELRTSEKPEDRQLLQAMGVLTGHDVKEQLGKQKAYDQMHALLQRSAQGTELSAEAKAALKAAQAHNVAINERALAFNRRVDELTAKGFTVDQAILQMRANAKDRALLAAMNQ